MLSTEELLNKAFVGLSTVDGGANAGAPIGSAGSDFGGTAQAPLSVEQVTQFIELMSAGQVMLPDVRTVTSAAAKWQESILDFGATRVAQLGTEGTRLATGDRVKPGTGKVEISTVLLRAEVPVSDETLEDNVARATLAQSIQRLLADRFGFDIEDLMINDDGQLGDTWNSVLPLGGWMYQANHSGHSIAGSGYGQDYQELFRAMLESMPDRFRRGLETDGRFYIPKRVEVKYRDILASRGTALGDLALTGTNDLTYQGITIKGVHAIAIAGGGTTAPFLLAHKNNLYAGFHRSMTFESWRDPREGATSFICTARVDARIAVPDAVVTATSVDVTV